MSVIRSIATKYCIPFYAISLSLILFSCGTPGEDNSSAVNNEEAVIDQDTIVSGLNHLKKSRNNTHIPIKGKVIMLDTMPPPKVVPAGKPRIVPLKDNTAQAGIPEVIKIPEKLTIVVPGKDSIPLPEVYNVQIDTLKMSYSEPVLALPPRFKDEANCNIRYLSVEQGFTDGMVFNAVQDKRNNMWFATNKALIKYDGSFLTNYPFATSGVFVDSKGNLWFPTNGGIINFDGNICKKYSIYPDTDIIRFNYAKSIIIEDKNGNIWFASEGSYGIFKYEPEQPGFSDERFTHFSKKHGLISDNINCITEDKGGNIWFGSNGSGLCKYEAASNGYPNGRFIHYSFREGLSNNVVTSIIEDRNGILWIGTYGGGVNIYDGKSFKHLNERQGLSHNIVLTVFESKNGDLWFGTFGGGLCKYEKQATGLLTPRFTYFTIADNLVSNHISSILEDNSGNMWITSTGEGVMIYKRNSFTHITPDMGMEFDFLRSPFEDTDGNFWFGEERGGGLCKFDGKNFNYYTRKEGLCGDSITSVIQDKAGNIWIGTIGSGLCKFDGQNFTTWTNRNGLLDNKISYLHEDKYGNIWIGTETAGVCRFDGKSFYHITKKDGLCGNLIQYIMEDSKGNIWFGTRTSGAYKYDGISITNFSLPNGLDGNYIGPMLEDTYKNIWFGIGQGGLTRHDPDSPDPSSRFVQFREQGQCNQKDGTNCYDILYTIDSKFLVNDDWGNIWYGTGKGINLLTLPEDGIVDNIKVDLFTRKDGLKGDNPVVYTAFIDSKNRLCYGYMRAFTTLDLNTLNGQPDPR